MAKYHGVVGYGTSEETSPGVYEDVIIEKSYFGDVVRNVKNTQETDKVNNDIFLGNSISILADAYATKHFFAIRYVEWAGALWTVSAVEVQSPRLLLRLGGVYNGPRPTTSPPSTPGSPGGGSWKS